MASDPGKTSAAPNSPVAAVVLAGGLSRRMGGGDKPLLRLHGRTLLDHVVARLRPQVGVVALNANGDAARFASPGLTVLPDPLPGHPGPLAGVLAAMRWARRLGMARVLTVPGDTPFLPRGLVARLAAADGLAYAASSGRAHPTVALWPVGLADGLAAAIEGGQRRVRDWADANGAVAVDFGEVRPDPFFNVNTPEDLAVAASMVPDR